jgi:RecB family exonuclease
VTESLKAISWSELKTFQRCPKQHEYKYVDRLVPKRKARPLYLGSWIHAALESYYVGGDWKIGHKEYVKDYNKLFEEERAGLETKRGKRGRPLPEIVSQIMKSYLWYYREDGWTVKAVEQEFEVDTPLKINGRVQPLQGIIDLVIEDPEGRWWVVDHKTTGTIPDANAFHAMDPQLMLYPWAAKQAWGWDISGVIYNYVKSKPPTIPQITKAGNISKRKLVTDYPTLRRFLRTNGYDPLDFGDILRPLRKRSPFLRRYRLPREAVVTKGVLLDSLATAKHIREDARRYRVITRDCASQCPYHDLCRNELNGFDTTLMRSNNFTPKEERIFGNNVDTFEEESDEDEDE